MKTYLKISAFFTLLALAFTLVGLPVYAQEINYNTNSNTGSNNDSTTGLIKTDSSVVKQCVKTAAKTKAAAYKTAKDAYKKTLSDLITTKNEAVKAAKALTDKVAKKAAIKTANKTWQDGKKKARQDLNAARKAARDQYKVERQACQAK